MGLIYFTASLLLLLLFLIMLIFSVAIRIRFIIDTNNSNLNLSFLWLYPFLKVLVSLEDVKPMLTVYLFKMKVFRMAVKANKGKKSGSNLMQLAKPTEINITTSYGFKDLYATGVVCGAVNMVRGFINATYIKQFPDFMSNKDYIYLNANAKVNIGTTIVNYTKSKIKNY